MGVLRGKFSVSAKHVLILVSAPCSYVFEHFVERQYANQIYALDVKSKQMENKGLLHPFTHSKKRRFDL